MSFIRIFSPKSLKPTLLATLVALSLPLSLTACNQPAKVEQASEKTQTTAQPATEEVKTATNETAKSSNDQAISTITLETALQAVKAPLKSSGKFDEATIKCVEELSPEFGLEKVQAFYESQLTPEELKQVNEFYASDLAKAFTAYGTDQFLIAIGETIENPAAKPTEEQIKQMLEFSKTPVGIKYGKINMAEGDGSLNNLVTELLEAELTKCNVTV